MNDALSTGDVAAGLTGPEGPRAWAALACLLVIYFVVDVGFLYWNGSSAKWSTFFFCFWLVIDAVSGFIIYKRYGGTAAGNFVDGLLLEGLFSIDNLALFFFIFQALRTPADLYGKVLSCGMMVACPLRLAFYLAEFGAFGVPWVVVVTGASLVISGVWALISSIRRSNEELSEWSAEKKPVLRCLMRTGRLWPFYDYRGRFFVKALPMRQYPTAADPSLDPDSAQRGGNLEEGVPLRGARKTSAKATEQPRWQATMLLVALFAIEAVDIVFAMDSTMANVALSSNVFICYVSSIFALFTMRSLFASMADLLDSMWLMRYVLAVLLIGIGVKVILEPWYPIPQHHFLWFLAMYMIIGLLVSFAGFILTTPGAAHPIELPPSSPQSRDAALAKEVAAAAQQQEEEEQQQQIQGAASP